MNGPARPGLWRGNWPLLGLLGLITLAFLAVLLRGHDDPSQVGRVYLLVAGIIVISLSLLELFRVARQRGWRAEVKAERARQLPPQLEALQDVLRISRSSRAHYLLQAAPLLREVAVDRLLLRGISLERDPERAKELLGPELARALDTGPDDGLAVPRLGAAELERTVAALEGL